MSLSLLSGCKKIHMIVYRGERCRAVQAPLCIKCTLLLHVAWSHLGVALTLGKSLSPLLGLRAPLLGAAQMGDKENLQPQGAGMPGRGQETADGYWQTGEV